MQFDRSPGWKLAGPTLEKAAAGFRRWIRLRRAPTFRPITATLALVFLNLLLFQIVWLIGSVAQDRVYQAAALQPERVAAGEWWRLLTHGFVHGDWDHLIWNCVYLLAFGLLLEPAIGSAALVSAYLAGVLVSGAALTLLEAGVSVGASSAICALQGLLLARPLRPDARGWRSIRPVWLLAAFLTLEDLALGLQSGVSLVGHASGIVAGLWCGALLRRQRGEGPLWAPRARPLLATSAVTAGLVLGLAMDPDVQTNRRVNVAWRAESAGDGAVVASQADRIEHDADPERRNDAWALGAVAEHRLGTGDTASYVRLMERAAPTLERADVYRDLASVRLAHDPGSEREAEADLRAALILEPDDTRTMHDLARLYIQPDSPLFSPARARMLAWKSVWLTEVREPRRIRTLAWCDFRCGDVEKALQIMRKVVELDAGDPRQAAADRAELLAMEANALCGPEVTP
jgi:rhomboid protease GluP